MATMWDQLVLNCDFTFYRGLKFSCWENCLNVQMIDVEKVGVWCKTAKIPHEVVTIETLDFIRHLRFNGWEKHQKVQLTYMTCFLLVYNCKKCI